MKGIITTMFIMVILSFSSINVLAKDDVNNSDVAAAENKGIILRELNKTEDELTLDEKRVLFSTGVIWNQSYGNQTYSIRKNLSMTASLTSITDKPYTVISVTNNSKYPITVIAYEGAIGGSTTIRSTIIQSNRTGTLTITRNDVVRYGSMNIQGTNSSLLYNISIYNSGGNPIPCKVKAIKRI